jgi:hypothetical protein
MPCDPKHWGSQLITYPHLLVFVYFSRPAYFLRHNLRELYTNKEKAFLHLTKVLR